MNTAICSRVTGCDGQKLPPPHPSTAPRRASSSIHRQNGLLAGTSLNIGGSVQAGGFNVGSSVRSTNTAVSSRVTVCWGQKFPPPQPAVTPRRASSSIQRQNGLLAGTSPNAGVPQGAGT